LGFRRRIDRRPNRRFLRLALLPINKTAAPGQQQDDGGDNPSRSSSPGLGSLGRGGGGRRGQFGFLPAMRTIYRRSSRVGWKFDVPAATLARALKVFRFVHSLLESDIKTGRAIHSN
jgi:hypothetical protein